MTLVATDPSRRPRPRRGPLAGDPRHRLLLDGRRGAGDAAARRLRRRGDPHRGPQPARHAAAAAAVQGRPASGRTARRTPNPDPNKGGMFNNYNRNKLGVTLNMRDPTRTRAAPSELIVESSVRDRELRPGRDGALGPRPRNTSVSCDPDVIYARMSGFGHSGPVRRLPQLRPGRAGGVRAVAHQRAPRPRAVRMGPVVHGQPGGVLQRGGAADGDPAPATHRASAPTSTCRPSRPASSCSGRCCSTSRSTARHARGRTSRPATASTIRPPRRTACTRAAATTAGWRSPCSTTPSGRRSSARSGRPAWAADAAVRHATTAVSPTRTSSTSTSPAWTAAEDRHELMHRLQAAGVRAGAVQDAEDVNEHDPQMAHRDVFFELDHPVIGEARFEGVPFTSTSFARRPLALGAAARRGQRLRVRRRSSGSSDDEIAELADDGSDLMRMHPMPPPPPYARAAGRRARRRPGRRDDRAAVRPPRRRRGQGRAARRCAVAAHRAVRRRRSRPRAQPRLLVLQRRQAQRRRRPRRAEAGRRSTARWSPRPTSFVVAAAPARAAAARHRPDRARRRPSRACSSCRSPPFGLTGPWAEYQSSDLVALATSGLLITSGYDDHSIPPIRPGGDQAYHTAASFAHIAALLGPARAPASGRGGLIDVSIQEAAGVTVELANPYWFYPRAPRPAADLPARPAGADAAGDLPVRRRPVGLLRPDPRRPEAVAGAGASGWTARTWPSTSPTRRTTTSRTGRRTSHHIQDLVEVFFLLQDSRRRLPRGPAAGPADRRAQRARGPLRRRAPRRPRVLRRRSTSPASGRCRMPARAVPLLGARDRAPASRRRGSASTPTRARRPDR